jgi:glycosyltransferase involved in cell wall biosynthesis
MMLRENNEDPMTIGVDGHDLEGKRTGVGRYLMSILRSWDRTNALGNDEVILFFKQTIPPDIPARFSTRLLEPLGGKQSTALFVHVLLPSRARRESIDVLWCPGYVAPLPWRGKLVLTLHDIIYEARPDLFEWQSPADFFLLKFVSKRAARHAARILVPSRFTASEVERLYGIPRDRIVLTKEATDEHFCPPQDLTAARTVARRYGVEGPYFFFVGSIFTRRHVPDCLKAFAKIADAFPNQQFLLAGANRTRRKEELGRVIEEVNASLQRCAIVWVPYADPNDLPALYGAATATVWLSEYEGFGLPPLESLACGTPVITTTLASLPETVGSCAIFVRNPSDINEIANAMRTILSDEDTRQRLSQCGPSRAATFSWDQCAVQTLATLRDVAEKER